MGLFHNISSEFRYNFGNWKRAIPIIAIFLIPILYAGTFLWAFWDPYGHLDRLPVAVVNQDVGTTFRGQTIHAGNQLVAQLKTNASFDWHFVTASQAQTGLRNNHYEMEIDIPNDFSQRATAAAMNASAPRPELVAITNARHNYIASIIGQNAAEKLMEQTAEQLTRTYTSSLVAGISQMGTGFRSAAEGAQQLAVGAAHLKTGAAQVGSGATGVANGSQTIATRLSQAAAGSQKLSTGVTDLYHGSSQLNAGLQQLNGGANRLSQAAAQETQGFNQYMQGLTQAQSGATATATGASQVAGGLQQFAKAHPELATDPTLQALLAGSQQVATGAAQVASGQQKLQSAASQLQQGQAQLTTGINQLQSGVGSAAAGSQKLVSQVPQLVQGAQQLNTGLAQLSQGADTLATSSNQLASGAAQVTTGIGQLQNGAEDLASRLSAASKGLSAAQQRAFIQAASNPVQLRVEKLGQIATYGQGFTPYFLSLGLFVGALLMSIVIAFRDPARTPTSGLAWFGSKLALVGVVAIVQALLADLLLFQGFGLQVPNPMHFIWFSLLTSLTFVAVIQFLVSSMANPGRFLAVILLILQLTSSSGTYPVILSPVFFQNIHAYLPMTYSVDGFRYLVGGGNPAFFSADVWHLLAFTVVFLVLSAVYFWAQYRRSYRHGRPAVE